MKLVVVSIAYCAGNFVKVFLNSFREYYKEYPVMIVDANYKGKYEAETKYLKRRDDIIYIRNDYEVRTHGANLDIAYNAALDLGYSVMLNVDIDSMFLQSGLITNCWNAFCKGKKYGGKWHVKHFDNYEKRVELAKQGRSGHVHSSLGFYDLKLLRDLDLSFDEHVYTGNKNRDTAEHISYVLRDLGFQPHLLPSRFAEHFVAGTITRDSEGDKHLHKGLLDKGKARKHYEKIYQFFNREDVRRYLK